MDPCESDMRSAIGDLVREDEGGDGHLGLEIRWLGDEALITQVRKDSPAARAGIQPGYVLEGFDEAHLPTLRCFAETVDEAILDQLVYGIFNAIDDGPPGQEVEVEVRGDADARETFTLAYALPDDVERVKFGNLPEMVFRYDAERLGGGSELQIGRIRWNNWMLPVAEHFEKSILEFEDTDGVILDLRGNPGGVAGLAMGIAGYFIHEKLSLGTMRSRNDELNMNVNPRKVSRAAKRIEAYPGLVAILIDGFSASTSEIFAAGMQDLERARIFGTRTMGAALPAVIEELPNGDLFMHAIADFTRPDGTRVEGHGVTPDEVVEVTREELLTGRDPALEAAIAWIGTQSQ